ncbi:MAG: DUF3135 domain-containing protein [bacterium]
MSATQKNQAVKDFKFDFDYWKKLNEENPEQFERERAQLNQSHIDSTADNHKQRLEGLLFQINSNRDLAKTPLDSCIKISGMMWQSVEELRSYVMPPRKGVQLRSPVSAEIIPMQGNGMAK